MIFGTLQYCSFLILSVDSIFMKFIVQCFATWRNLTTRISLLVNT